MSKKRPARAGRPPKPASEKTNIVFQFKMQKRQDVRYRKAARERGLAFGVWIRLACDAACKEQGIE